jgi:hypothetical protein
MGFEVLETIFEALESSFEANFDGSWQVRSQVTASERLDPLPAWVQTHCRRGSSQIHSQRGSRVGLT